MLFPFITYIYILDNALTKFMYCVKCTCFSILFLGIISADNIHDLQMYVFICQLYK